MTDERAPADAFEARIAEFERTPEGRKHAARIKRVAALSDAEPGQESRWLGWLLFGAAMMGALGLGLWRFGVGMRWR